MSRRYARIGARERSWNSSLWFPRDYGGYRLDRSRDVLVTWARRRITPEFSLAAVRDYVWSPPGRVSRDLAALVQARLGSKVWIAFPVGPSILASYGWTGAEAFRRAISPTS